MLYSIKDINDTLVAEPSSSRVRQVSDKRKTLIDRMVNLEPRFDHFIQYHKEWFNTVGQMRTQCASHMRVNLTQFLKMPIFQLAIQ